MFRPSEWNTFQLFDLSIQPKNILEIYFSDSRNPDWNLSSLFDLPFHASDEAICVCCFLETAATSKLSFVDSES